MTDTIPPVPIVCACGNQIGEEIYIEGMVLVHAGGGLWHELRGHCAQCNEPFYWSTKGSLVRRAIVSRKAIGPHDQEEGK